MVVAGPTITEPNTPYDVGTDLERKKGLVFRSVRHAVGSEPVLIQVVDVDPHLQAPYTARSLQSLTL